MRTKILMLVVLLGLTGAVMAQMAENAPKRPMHGQNNEMRMKGDQRGPANGLNLTTEQKEAFKQSMLTTMKKLKPLRNELGEVKAHQKTLMTAESPDLNAIDKNIEKMGALKVEMEKIQARQRVEMRSKLSDEQRLKFDARKGGKMKHRGPQGMRPGRGMHEGPANK